MNSELKNLDLSSNLLGEKPLEPFLFRKLNKLEVLNLDSNAIKALPAEIFASNVNLKKLFLNNNTLTTLDKQIFSTLGNLESLYLANNQISDINKHTFNALSSIKMLSLSVRIKFKPVSNNYLGKQTTKSSRRHIFKS